MNTFIDRQLAQIKYTELLQEAAEARADRKNQTADSNPLTRKLKFAIGMLPVVLWVVWAFIVH